MAKKQFPKVMYGIRRTDGDYAYVEMVDDVDLFSREDGGEVIGIYELTTTKSLKTGGFVLVDKPKRNK